jgi:hypothetical protein
MGDRGLNFGLSLATKRMSSVRCEGFVHILKLDPYVSGGLGRGREKVFLPEDGKISRN